jgi:hypothetical protein
MSRIRIAPTARHLVDAPREHVIEQARHLFGGAAPAEAADPLEAALPQLLAERGIRQHPVHRVRQVDCVVGIDQDGRVAAHFRQRGAARGDHRRAAGHRLEHRQAETLPERGQHKAGRAGVEVAERTLAGVALEAHDVGEAERLHPLSHRPGIRGLALSADDQPRAAVASPQDGEGIEQAQQVLVGQEIAHVQDIAVPAR